MKKRLLSLVLCLVMVFSLLPFAGFAAQNPVEANGATVTNPDTAASVRRDLFLSKNLTANDNGTFDLKLESYATGEVTTKVVTHQVPTDFVLVVDQSGSMNTQDMPVEYVEATMPSGGWTFDSFENGTDEDGNTIDRELYFLDQNTGDYYRVYRKWGDLFEYQPRNSIYAKSIVDSRNLHWFADTAGTESTFNSQYYYQPSEDQNVDLYPRSQYLCGQPIQEGGANDHNFYPINISSQGRTLYYSIRFNYVDSTGTRHYLRYLNNATNSTANRNKDTGNCIWYRDPDGNYFGPGDSFRFVFNISYNFANDFVLGWINGNADYDTFYTYGQITDGFQSGMYIQNPLFIRHVGYNSLAYRDSNNVEHIISHTDYCDADDNPTKDKQGTTAFYDDTLTLYEATTTKQTRLLAVQNALNEFVKNVANQTDSDGVVNHRVAIVGFSSDGYNNNELLTNTYNNFAVNHNASWTNSSGSAHYSLDGKAHDGVQKSTADNQTNYYKYALVEAHSDTGENGVNPALPDGIKGLTAHGGTEPQTGLNMAYQILNTNELKDEYAAGTRNAVVVFFTDGRPGNNSTVNQYDAANRVVSSASTIKQNISGVEIYSVGVFGEADGNPLTYQSGNAGPYYYYGDLQDLYNSLYCSSRGRRDHNTDSNEKVSSNRNISDVSLSSVNYQSVNFWPQQIEETYYPDYAKTTSAFYGNTTASWSWSTGGFLGIAATNHSASGQIPTYRLSFYWRDCLRNTENYPAQENDTISDYMMVVSSSYKQATSFDNGWSNLSRENKQSRNYNSTINAVRGAKEAKNYYMLCTDTTRLNEVFVNIAEDVSTAGTSVTLNDRAVLKDIVNTSVFDLPENVNNIVAYTVEATASEQNGVVTYTFGSTPKETLTPTIDADGKTVSVSGFDYASHYVMPNPPAGVTGRKLVVEIKGLTLKDTFTGSQASNGGAGIFAADENDVVSTDPTLDIDSPTFSLNGSVNPTYVIDYNAKMILATDAKQMKGETDNNGNFNLANEQVTYQLSTQAQSGENAVINSAYAAVDTALVYGIPANQDGAEKAWNQITTVPASSVYYDDSFTEANAQVVTPGDVVKQTGTLDGSGSHKFTFYGTGIDVYCTTHDGGGYVSAALYQGNAATGSPYKTLTVKNQSQGDYYNTPTVHFADLEPAVYTIWLYANSGAQYKIDGVRVYNPVQAGTTAASELAKTDEANAHYFNLHKLLLNTTSQYTALTKDSYGELSGEEAATVSGILYLDNADAICMTSNDADGNPQLIFANQFDLYKNNSPINEIYLQSGQGVAFKLANWKLTGEKVYLGVSAPKGSGTVYINGHEQSITSSVDQYYDITEWIATEGTTKGVVSIKTSATDTNLISVTNLKITGATTEAITGQNPPADAANDSNKLNSYRRLAFAPMLTSTVEEIAEETVPELFVTEEDPQPSVEPSVEPSVAPSVEPSVAPSVEPSVEPTTQPASGFAALIQQIFSNFVNSLFGSIARLFGN